MKSIEKIAKECESMGKPKPRHFSVRANFSCHAMFFLSLFFFFYLRENTETICLVEDSDNVSFGEIAPSGETTYIFNKRVRSRRGRPC